MLATLVLSAFALWLVLGAVWSVRSGVCEAADESPGLGGVVGLARALPTEWIVVGLAVLVGALWA
jgi:hypothetical protein